MRIILGVYIFICIMLFLFNIFFILIKNIKKNRMFSSDRSIDEKFTLAMENYEQNKGFDKDTKDYISKKIEKAKNLIELMDTFEKNKNIIPEEVVIEIREMIIEKEEIYVKKNEMEKAYYPYVLSTFDYKDREFTRYEKSRIVDFLDCESLYTFVNTMELIYKISDLELLEMAMEKVNVSEIFYHKKLLIDGLMKYNGDEKDLRNSIEKNFFSYGDGIQEGLVDFCRMRKLNINDLCMEILNKEHEIYPEVRYSAMRYFISNRDEDAKYYFIRLIQEENLYWVEKMLSIQVLYKYNDDIIYELIKECITDRNWYVRNAAIKYVHGRNIDQEEMFSILDKRDKYANEEILYEYKDEKNIFEYIKEMMAKFAEEEKNKVESEGI